MKTAESKPYNVSIAKKHKGVIKMFWQQPQWQVNNFSHLDLRHLKGLVETEQKGKVRYNERSSFLQELNNETSSLSILFNAGFLESRKSFQILNYPHTLTTRVYYGVSNEGWDWYWENYDEIENVLRHPFNPPKSFLYPKYSDF